MLKKIAKLGLAGLLSISLAGSAIAEQISTKPYPSVPSSEVSSSSLQSEKKIRKISSISYTLGDIIQEDRKIEIPVFEEKKEKTIEEIFNPQESKSKRSIEEKVLYSNKPADAMVKVSSEEIGFGNEGTKTIFVQVHEGRAVVEMTAFPFGVEASSKKIFENADRKIKQGLKKAGQDIAGGYVLAEHQAYRLEIETASNANIGLVADDTRFEDDKKTFHVHCSKEDLSLVYRKVIDAIKADLEKRYSQHSVLVRVLDEETHTPIENAVARFIKKKSFSKEELCNTASSIIGKYCFVPLSSTEPSAAFYEGFSEELNKIDLSYLLEDLDRKEFEINPSGEELRINVPSEYNIEIIHQDYHFGLTTVKFTPEMRGVLDLYLSKTSQKVKIGFGRGKTKAILR